MFNGLCCCFRFREITYRIIKSQNLKWTYFFRVEVTDEWKVLVDFFTKVTLV